MTDLLSFMLTYLNNADRLSTESEAIIFCHLEIFKNKNILSAHVLKRIKTVTGEGGGDLKE